MTRLHLLLVLLTISHATAEVRFTTTDFAPAPDSAFSIEGKAHMAVYQAFRKKHPDIVPEGNPMGLKFEGAAGEAPLLMSIAGRTAPTVMHVNGRQSGGYVEREFLVPLDAFIDLQQTESEAKAAGTFDEMIMYREEFETCVRPQVRDVVYRTGPDGKKHVYFLPYSYWVRVLAYNKTLFQEAGIDPEDGYPKTWEEMLAVARTLQRPDEDSYGMLVDTSAGASWIALPFFYSMGLHIVEQDPSSGEWRACFGEKENVKKAAQAADFYLQLVDGPWTNRRTGKINHGAGRTRDAWHLWDKGRVGMVLLYMNDLMMSADSHLSGLNPDELGLVPIPRSPVGTSTTELHLRGLGICATTTEPEMIRAAWQFIRFISGPEAEKAMIRVYVENGYGSYINRDKLKEHGYEEYLKTVPRQWAKTLDFAMNNMAPAPYGKNCQAYILRASEPLQTAYSERLPRNPDRRERLASLAKLYKKANKSINEKMLNRIPEETMRKRRRVAGAVLLCMLVGFALLFTYVWRLFSPPKDTHPGTQRRKRYWLAYAMLFPAVATILTFHYYPLLRGAVMAFQDYSILGSSTFVGLDNFAMVLHDPSFWMSLLRTVEYVAWSLLFVFLTPIVLAVVLSEIPKGSVFFRIVYYLPAVVSGLVVMLMWKMFFDPTESGLLNQLFAVVGAGPFGWLSSKRLAMVSILLPLGWSTMGPGCLIYLAALKTVPEDLYEAAAIDGGGFCTRLFHVALPTMRPLILIQLIFVLIGAFQSADNVLIMTGGGPDGATNVIGLEIFFNAYVYMRFGSAVAIAWILGFLLIGLTMFQMRRISRMSFTTAG
jgi:ABC-type sugar transport system permease subunit/ABC-type glycerol-3-phosphate transport system substrate-binding protein